MSCFLLRFVSEDQYTALHLRHLTNFLLGASFRRNFCKRKAASSLIKEDVVDYNYETLVAEIRRESIKCIYYSLCHILAFHFH